MNDRQVLIAQLARAVWTDKKEVEAKLAETIVSDQTDIMKDLFIRAYSHKRDQLREEWDAVRSALHANDLTVEEVLP